MPYILALDQGTTSSRAIVFDHDGAHLAPSPRRNSPRFSARRLGRARSGRDLGVADRRRRRSARTGAGPARRWPRSASPTSARRPSSGIARPATRSTTRSSGRTAAPPTTASGSRRKAPARRFRRRPACSSTPFGILAPIAWNLAGLARNSLISWSSSTASSAPATSANVVFGVSLLTSLALLRPKLMTRLPPPCIWLITNSRTPPMMMIGRNVSSRLNQALPRVT